MVRLFTTSTMISAGVPNYAKRAQYLAESGMRYAISELRNTGYTEAVINTLNSTTYTLDDGDSFDINVFGKWFKADADYPLAGSGTLLLNVPEGELPDDTDQFNIPDNAWVVALESYRDSLFFTGGTPDSFVAEIQDVQYSSIDITLTDAFAADQDEAICLAVKSTTNQNSVTELTLPYEAIDFFPEKYGSFYITGTVNQKQRYYYEEAQDQGTSVKLTNLSDTVTVAQNDYVILSPRNHRVSATGNAGSASTGSGNDISMDFYQNITTPQEIIPPAMDLPADIPTDEIIADMDDTIDSAEGEVKEAVTVDTTAGEEKIILGGDALSAFGAVLYGGTTDIGGTAVCTDGKCQFNEGMRAFFILEYDGTGDGITFALINGSGTDNVNDKTSVGGHGGSGELMGYAGDGLDAGNNPLPGATPGLYPPKMALEFDTYVNSARDDPNLGSNRDVLQYVFWGDSSTDLDDDNIHDTGAKELNWQFDTGNNVESSPAVGADGTIYVGSKSNHLWAINPAGTEKWKYSTGGDVNSSPAIGADGTIYVGSNDNYLYAIYSNGTRYWRYLTGGDVKSSPAVDPTDGMIYVGSKDNDGTRGYLYVIKPNGTLNWRYGPSTSIPDNIESSPVVSDGTYWYMGADDDRLYQIVRGLSYPSGYRVPSPWPYGNIRSSPAIGADGTIYVGSDGNFLWAMNPNRTTKWKFTDPSGDVRSTPAIGDDGTIYVGSNDNKLYAIDPDDGSKIWDYTTGGDVESSPAVGDDGTIYVGSKDNKIHAINPDGTKKWDITTGDDVKSSPTIASVSGVDVLYIGSNDDDLYSITLNDNPLNLKDNYFSYDDLTADEKSMVSDANNWLNSERWAIRIEVTRSTTANASGKYEYTLHTWIRMCTETDCSDILGTHFEDTRIDYAAKDPHLEQDIELSQADHDEFDTFLFGFTTATGGATQTAVITDLQVGFIRPGDYVIAADSSWP